MVGDIVLELLLVFGICVFFWWKLRLRMMAAVLCLSDLEDEEFLILGYLQPSSPIVLSHSFYPCSRITYNMSINTQKETCGTKYNSRIWIQSRLVSVCYSGDELVIN